MLISEIFHSIQGEGELTGVPSVFVRTSGCNLRCRWCDTKYASWEPEGEEMSTETLLSRIGSYPARHVVLTGGEPMVARGIHDLARALRLMGKHITIETAGTIRPEGIACDLASLSPKLRHSTPEPEEISPGWRARHEQARFQPKVLREWIEQYPFQLKFVIKEENDLLEIDDCLAELGSVPPHKVQLMPEGTSPAQVHERTGAVVAWCKQRGFRFCHRLHLDLFGNMRGT